jgi:hypothetical protein
MRHLFITSLERAGIRPKMAQVLARHSDIRLTMGIYTHINLHNQSSAIESLPAPPAVNGKGKEAVTKTVPSIEQLDAIWNNLPDDAKARIMDLAIAGKK